MNKKLFALIIPIAVAVVFVLILAISGIASYNDTIGMRENIDGYEAEIKSRLLERHDKMTQIISAVEGLEEHAETIYNMIVEAREAYASAVTAEDFQNADNLESVALDNLLLIVENNPAITATGAYNTYIYEVSGMENALSVARRDFNNAVRDYNTKAKRFPRVLLIGMYGVEKEMPYWPVPEEVTELPLLD